MAQIKETEKSLFLVNIFSKVSCIHVSFPFYSCWLSTILPQERVVRTCWEPLWFKDRLAPWPVLQTSWTIQVVTWPAVPYLATNIPTSGAKPYVAIQGLVTIMLVDITVYGEPVRVTTNLTCLPQADITHVTLTILLVTCLQSQETGGVEKLKKLHRVS